MTPQDPRDSTAFRLCYTSCLRRRELTMLDTADSGPDPRCACWDRTHGRFACAHAGDVVGSS